VTSFKTLGKKLSEQLKGEEYHPLQKILSTKKNFKLNVYQMK